VQRSKQVLELGSKQVLGLGSKLELELERSKLVLVLGSILAGSRQCCHDHDDGDLLRLLVRTSLPGPKPLLRVLHSSSDFSSRERNWNRSAAI
jgi:hypothetical protein